MIRLIDSERLIRKEFWNNYRPWTGKEVRKAIRNAPTVCKWHDPDEELPEKDGEYLCLSPLANGEWRTDIYRWKGRHFVWTHPKYGEGLVTGMYWWMEIPPMPKMKGESEYVADGNAET